eukprot:gnl/MRDRNA2_/MRDRNA2_57158_c0_seq2.p1 gnl/MRDRNA2_/MRDRNA2_57158_c0~~gnl/MRDRNA2_/MRDRNA2_57158_c0_seq2.p1  ORF type:complete len:441 (+),score=108.67 gnl/MRDRNA2_/MRDRNA2_57158_c0_seq2:1036-2358(+)
MLKELGMPVGGNKAVLVERVTANNTIRASSSQAPEMIRSARAAAADKAAINEGRNVEHVAELEDFAEDAPKWLEIRPQTKSIAKTIEELTVAELRAALREVSLPTSGTKAVLVERLVTSRTATPVPLDPESDQAAVSADKHTEPAAEFEDLDTAAPKSMETRLKKKSIDVGADEQLTALESLTVKDLREALKQLGLSTRGKKGTLLERLTTKRITTAARPEVHSSEGITVGTEAQSRSLQKLRVAELREALRQSGHSTEGTKDTLVQRLSAIKASEVAAYVEAKTMARKHKMQSANQTHAGKASAKTLGKNKKLQKPRRIKHTDAGRRLLSMHSSGLTSETAMKPVSKLLPVVGRVPAPWPCMLVSDHHNVITQVSKTLASRGSQNNRNAVFILQPESVLQLHDVRECFIAGMLLVVCVMLALIGFQKPRPVKRQSLLRV